jgi:threonine/homoserine/homoserine lactone efflux protein
VFGVLLLLLAGRSWRKRPAPGTEPEMPKWMAGIDGFAPGKALGFGLLLAGVNPKNLLLAAGAGSALALIGPSTTEAVVSLIVFVIIGSLTIAGPVVFYLVGGDRAKSQLDSAKGWLTVHNDAVMTVLFLVFGVNLIAKGLPPLSR